nr:RNA-directed DNA polymerase, eukaryota [Tanacetum cinerariifolium]
MKISNLVFVTNFPEHFSSQDLWKFFPFVSIMGASRSFNSKEDLTMKISNSVFVTNFPERFSSQDLWKNLDCLIGNLCTIWIGRLHLHANPVRFHKDPKVSSAQQPWNKEGLANNSIASVLKTGSQSHKLAYDSTPAIVLDDSCVEDKDLSGALMGKIKDINALSNLYSLLEIEGFDKVNLTYLGDFWVLIETVSSKSKENMCSLSEVEDEDDATLPYKKLCIITKPHIHIDNRIKVIVKGCVYWVRVKELDVWAPDFNNYLSDNDTDKELPDDEILNQGSGYNDLDCVSNKDNDIDHVSESSYMNDFGAVPENSGKSKDAKTPSVDPFGIYDILNKKPNNSENKTDDPTFPLGFTPGDMADNHVGTKDDGIDKPMGDVQSNKEARSSLKSKNNSTLNIKPGGSILDVMENSVEIGQTMGLGQPAKKGWIQEINRKHKERFGTVFNALGANAFNQFVALASLVDLPLEEYSFTLAYKSASKMSKLDRFLVSEGLLSVFPSLSAICLDRHLSDHRPILMRELVVDYGPTPFRIFNSWFSKPGFDKIVEDAWNNSIIVETNSIVLLKRKLQNLKSVIKSWSKKDNHNSNAEKHATTNHLAELDRLIDQGNGTEELVKERTGDENSKYFHGILNKKRSQLAIRGVLVDGDWIDEPAKVKNEFLNHFTNRFSKHVSPKILLDSQMLHTLASKQVDDLERNVTYGEIKRAVWDYGTNKSLGPDGFSFDFIRRYWKIIDKDVVKAVEEFFDSSCFPLGCNASFIMLIPKMQVAKLVKDFRPITLIGCIYKIVAKILANRLSLVISKLVSDVQSTFVSSRQILDGPFILNELISWSKAKKSKVMIFKIDFEKAFDSVKWDFLDDTFVKYGFGSKWRGWIQGCLNLAKGLILVNGSPTFEFKFHKGLKQGDPLPPFLFILIMESLYFLFSRTINARLFKGIRIDNSLTLSHLFYVDDAVFIGKWDRSNLITITNMLKCFFMASGLKINIHKSKLIGIGVPHEEVISVANLIGCSTLSRPFNYLGVKVGGSSSRINYWDEDSSLWSRLIKAMYGDCGSIDNPKFFSRTSHWSDIIKEVADVSLKGINLLSFIKKKVGSGDHTCFWKDVWLDDRPLKLCFPRLFALECDKNVSVSNKIRDPSLFSSFRRDPRGGTEEEQHLNLVEKVASAILSNSADR